IPFLVSWLPDSSDSSCCSGFFPSRIARQRGFADRLFFNQFFRGVFRRHRRGDWLLGARRKFIPEFFDETLRRPGAGFAKGANGPAGNVVGDALESVGILN